MLSYSSSSASEDDDEFFDAENVEHPSESLHTVAATKEVPQDLSNNTQSKSICNPKNGESSEDVKSLRRNFFPNSYSKEEKCAAKKLNDEDGIKCFQSSGNIETYGNLPSSSSRQLSVNDEKKESNNLPAPRPSYYAKAIPRDKIRLPNEVHIRPEEAKVEGPFVNYDDEVTVRCRDEKMKKNSPNTDVELRDIGLMDEIISNLNEMGVQRLKKIQQYVIPYMLKTTQDLIVSAKTGSGKTMSYLIPIINQIAQENRKNPPTKRKPRVAILLQNHETANQVYLDAKKIANGLELGIIPAIGNNNMGSEIGQLKNKGGDIIIGTTGRFIQYVSEEKIPLDKLKTLIFDEADLFVKDRNWEESMSVFNARTPKDRRTFLFSATYDDRACLTFDTFVNDYWFIAAGELNQVESLIRQNFILIKAFDSSKHIMELLKKKAIDGRCPKTLIFTNSIDTAEWLTARLRLCIEVEMPFKFRVASLHSELSAKDRQISFDCFLYPSTDPVAIDIIVASDKICCGVSTPAEIVINYEIPFDISTYILRVGRTGRNGHSGEAYTFIDPKELDCMHSRDRQKLCSMIEAAKQTSKTPGKAGMSAPSTSVGEIPVVLESFFQKYSSKN